MQVFGSQRGYLEYMLLILVCFLGGMMVFSNYLDERERKQHAPPITPGPPALKETKPKRSLTDTEKTDVPEHPREGKVVPLKRSLPALTAHDIHEKISKLSRKKQSSSISWKNRNFVFALTALGVDLRHHAANAFLIHYLPFKTERYWIVMQTIASKLRYALDEDTFVGGYEEMWQTSKQAYRNMRGDCEDHAILLADWLSELGYDARVVVGDYNGGGHAWVVLFKDGKEYLIEATDKHSRRKYPLAKFHPEYQPEMMFNQDFLWHNKGSKLTTSYSGDSWSRVSKFEAYF